VKLRVGNRFGAAVEAIDERKLADRCCSGYRARSWTCTVSRIDVITIDVRPAGGMKVEHYAGVS
jgi:hypothetical protein